MDKLKFVKPCENHKQQAIEFIQEFVKYKSDINGVGGLHEYLDDYHGWLKKLEDDRNRVPGPVRVPAETFFLIREADNRIVGMINIRLALNEKQKKFGGHIGYSIRPTERRKGYNKINLYLALRVCQQHGIKEVFMDCDKANPGSYKTIQDLGGKLIREYYESMFVHCTVQDYVIDVDKSIEAYKQYYEPYISDNSYIK